MRHLRKAMSAPSKFRVRVSTDHSVTELKFLNHSGGESEGIEIRQAQGAVDLVESHRQLNPIFQGFFEEKFLFFGQAEGLSRL